MSNYSVPCDGVFVFKYFLPTMDNKTIIRFGFIDILNDQDLGNCYHPQPLARLITLASTLIIPDITKTHPIIVVVYNYCILPSFIYTITAPDNHYSTLLLPIVDKGYNPILTQISKS